jgi:putative transposase
VGQPQARRPADAPGRAVGHGAPAQWQDEIRVPGIATAPDLVRRDFAPAAPNRLWVADLTEIATWEGKLYLAVVIDCYSRRCVGWAMAEHMRAELVVEALEMALCQRRPDAGLVHHSDRGGQ